TVATPLEQEINGVENMLYMSSYSTGDGSMALTITFRLGTDLDQAQVLVQNRVSIAQPKLPEEVRRLGVTTTKSSPDLMMVIHMLSPDDSYDQLYVSNYARSNIRDILLRLDGVGDLIIFGEREYSLRVWLDPDKMRARGLTTQDVIQALQQQSEQVTAGQVGMPPAPDYQSFQYTIDVSSRLDDPDQFAAVIVKTGTAGDMTRVRDIGRVELGAQTYGQFFSLDGQQAAGLAIFQTPGANALDVATEVDKKMKALAAEFPSGVAY
ncbi:efflux RND transporter permease subunit, partial [Rhizobiaceae sp. 2RAB30]